MSPSVTPIECPINHPNNKNNSLLMTHDLQTICNPASPLIDLLSLPPHLSYMSITLHARTALDIYITCKCGSILLFVNYFSCYLQALAELESHWFTDVDEISLLIVKIPYSTNIS